MHRILNLIKPFVLLMIFLMMGVYAKSIWFYPIGDFPKESESAVKKNSSDGRYFVGYEGKQVFYWDIGERKGHEFPLQLKKTYLKNFDNDVINITKNGAVVLGQKAKKPYYQCMPYTAFRIDAPSKDGKAYILGSDAPGHFLTGSSNNCACIWKFESEKNSFLGHVLDTSKLTKYKHLQSAASGISDKNCAVIGWVVTDPETVGFEWIPGKGEVTIGHLEGGTRTFPLAISSDGLTMVGKSNNSTI